ncbi:hypothetical protein AXG93_369s1360 [Marchantia polymorpha subsp. ruderalis]|nr:hypothetical protein AXG93_369s1360 [Marchantia polymorpha subsp. ruderalis]
MKLASAWGHSRIRRTLTKKNVSPTSTVTDMETKEVIALRLEVSMPLNSTHVFQMQKLRYLDIEELDEAYFICPSSVVLLRLRGEGNSLEDLVKGHLPACLVALDLKAPLKCFPTIVTEIRGLEVMKFEACLFEGLPETFINFQKLRHLTFSSCNGLHSLPEDFGLLSELRYLELHYCYDFEALPNSFGNLHSLQILKIVSLHNLQRLPQDFGALSNLERLVISDAPKISELPDSFGELHRLQDLHLDNMSSLRALPYSFGNLSQLWRLSMVGCAMTKELPDSFGDLPNLTNLDFRDCRSAEVFPASMHVIRRLPRLRYLIVQTRESEGNLSESELRALWTGEQPIK